VHFRFLPILMGCGRAMWRGCTSVLIRCLSTLLNMRAPLFLSIVVGFAVTPPISAAQEAATLNETATQLLSSETLEGLKLRSIGPALMGGRISDIVVHPGDRSTWYVAVGSGGVWKTENAGTTWIAIFDEQASYSIGCIALDPNNPEVVWVGSGENVSGRHVGFGDGVYRSRDGGAHFDNVGLHDSQHISRIVIDPRDSDVVFVAAEGPLWSSGGDRGLYKTVDGGLTWQHSLLIDAETGVTDVRLDPGDPDIVYAASYQRRRHTWSLLAGGDGSGIHKSSDGGVTWRRLSAGLPTGDMGKIGLAVSPCDSNVVYATIEAGKSEKGFYRSLDRGETWVKRNEYISGGTGPHYYQEIVASPHDVDTVYQMDVFMRVTRNGGADFEILGDGRNKHSDNHALVIDPRDPEHLIAGTDASVYESFDDGAAWRQISNLPVSQFYKIALDDASPFYSILAGAQDLGTLLGPSRTDHVDGVRNRDWFVPLGADGYGVAFEPGNRNVAYMEWQEGELYRYDRVNHELLGIKPQGGPGDPPDRFNWDSPLLLSPHSATRLYYGSQRIWRSDDRGHSWTVVSPDLTRNQNRYSMEAFGRVWSVDAMHDSMAMSKYGTTTTISESPKLEGLLYVGTDDGLVQVSEDSGESWREAGALPAACSETAYVNDIQASLHDESGVFLALDAHKVGDLRPWLFQSRDRGRTWHSIAGDLPGDAYVWSIVQDHVVPDLLFVGTEKGLFFSPNRGERWIQLKGGVPTISFRDLAIQRRDEDLVAASFGRGIFILDDYSALREISRHEGDAPSILFAVRDAWLYVPYEPMQARGQPSLGSTSYRAENPPFGAVFTYFLAESESTSAEVRRKREKSVRAAEGDVDFPGWNQLAAEAVEREPFVLFTIRDGDGRPVRRLRAAAKQGLHRTSWDLRGNAPAPIRLEIPSFRPPWASDPVGPLLEEGDYSVDMALVTSSGVEAVGVPQPFSVKSVPGAALPIEDRSVGAAFQVETSEFLRRALGASKELDRAREWLRHVRPALIAAPHADTQLFSNLTTIETTLAGLVRRLDGDPIRGRLNEASTPSIVSRAQRVAGEHWFTRQSPTMTHRQSLARARNEYQVLIKEMEMLLDADIPRFEAALKAAGATWTPGSRRK
jgi:photosystem II stability/assembly factor-like uncharacterized protein